MGFFLDVFGMTGTLATLYDFVSGKLRDDNKVFKNQLRKNIIAVCEVAIEALNESYELKNIIPSFIDEVVYDEVVKALENREQWNLNEIQKKLNISNRSIFMQLMQRIDAKLHTSFEYSQKDYMAWSHQKMKDIEMLLASIQSDIVEIKEAVIFDSAKKHNSPPSGKSRFHFTAKGDYFLELVGRWNELTQLHSFCGFDEDMEIVQNQPSFAWWMVTGAGGTGK